MNARDYAKAWRLGGRNTGSSYTAYVNGFSTTAKTIVTIVSASGNVVTARITARHFRWHGPDLPGHLHG